MDYAFTPNSPHPPHLLNQRDAYTLHSLYPIHYTEIIYYYVLKGIPNPTIPVFDLKGIL